jgi:hypothetical protein
MSEGHELTIKQILDSAWVRRLSRAMMIVFPMVVSAVGGAGTWVMYQNWQTSQQAVAAAATAASIAAEAVKTANLVSDKQDARAELADQRDEDAREWQKNLDDRLIRLNQRVSTEIGVVQAKLGELQGAVGELKGLIVRQSAQAAGVAAPFPTKFLR